MVFIQILIKYFIIIIFIIVSIGTTRLQGSIQGITSIGCVGNVLLNTL